MSQSVCRAPVREIRFAIEGTGLSHTFILLTQNVARLWVDIPTQPWNGAADIYDRGFYIANFLSACGSERKGRVVRVLRNVDQIVVKLRLKLNEDGTLVGYPIVANSGSSPFFQAAADSAVRAVYQCQPYELPKAKYALWRDMILNFDPSDMYGSG